MTAQWLLFDLWLRNQNIGIVESPSNLEQIMQTRNKRRKRRRRRRFSNFIAEGRGPRKYTPPFSNSVVHSAGVLLYQSFTENRWIMERNIVVLWELLWWAVHCRQNSYVEWTVSEAASCFHYICFFFKFSRIWNVWLDTHSYLRTITRASCFHMSPRTVIFG